jgi:hypothetical protein
MRLRDKNLRLALLKTLADVIDGHLKQERAAHQLLLNEHYAETGNKASDVLLPDGQKVGNMTLIGVSEGRYEVVDEAALLDWAKAHSPSSLRETVVPPQPERRFTEFYPAARAALLKRLRRDEAGQIVDDNDMAIPGVEYVEPGQPTSFQVRLTEAGKAAVLQAWTDGALDGLTDGTPLPQLGGSRPRDEFDAL